MDSCDSRSRKTYNDGLRLGIGFKCLLVRHFFETYCKPESIVMANSQLLIV